MTEEKEKDMQPAFEVVHAEKVEDENLPEVWIPELLPVLDAKKVNPVYKLYQIYKFIKLKRNMEAVVKNKGWDKLNEGQSLKYAKEILSYYDGDLKKAAKAVVEIGEHYESGWGGPWKMKQIRDNITDWEEGRLGK